MALDLTGFLSPDGEFIRSRPSWHMETAQRICEKYYPEEKRTNGVLYEQILLNDKSYVEFPVSGCLFCGEILTDKQRLFMEEHKIDANNEEQKQAIEKILLKDSHKRIERAVSSNR